MIVYRVGKTKYANDLSGEGARIFGGRWNNKGIECLYTSENRALAILEYTANVNIEDIPKSLSLVSIEIPDKEIFTVKEKDLPEGWNISPATSEVKDYGSALLKASKYVAIRVPSVIIPAEYNYLLNPNHIQSRKIKIINTVVFPYDARLKS